MDEHTVNGPEKPRRPHGVVTDKLRMTGGLRGEPKLYLERHHALRPAKRSCKTCWGKGTLGGGRQMCPCRVVRRK